MIVESIIRWVGRLALSVFIVCAVLGVVLTIMGRGFNPEGFSRELSLIFFTAVGSVAVYVASLFALVLAHRDD